MKRLPSSSAMYRALLNRDPSFEGIFFVGVRTTGIFCRPTCSARKPKAENVELFSSVQDALYAGYRPCSRCHPLEKEKGAPELVTKLCDMVQRLPSMKIADGELRTMGIDPSTARRQFLRYYGMTFHAYCRARRMGKALHEIREGESVIGAQIETGFESASGFWEAFKQVFGTPPCRSEDVNCLLARWIDTPLGAMVAFGNNDGIHLLEFVDRRRLEIEISELRHRTKSVIVPGTNTHLENLAEELKNYFEGTAIKFTSPVVMGGSSFEQGVWRLLQTIPPGETRSYAKIAQTIGRPTAARAVGRANGRNCLALIIPCHRVIRADGTLCGYGGGIWRKQWLLEHERRVTGKSSNQLSLASDLPSSGRQSGQG